MRKIILLVAVASALTGCSFYVEPHLSSTENMEIMMYAGKSEVSIGTTDSVMKKLISKKSVLPTETAKPPILDIPVNQSNVNTMSNYFGIEKDPLNTIQYLVELYGIDLGDITQMSKGSDSFSVIGTGVDNLEVMLQNEYVLIGCAEKMFLCISYEGDLLESYHNNSWENYDGEYHDYLELFDVAYSEQESVEVINSKAQSIMFISSRTAFSAEYCTQIAQFVYDNVDTSSVTEIFNERDTLWLIQTASGKRCVLQILLLNGGSERESLDITLISK